MSEYLVITGLSGAGRSTAADTFEDLGWFVIDNMPPSLIGKVVELVSRPASGLERVALVTGRGGVEYVEELGEALDHLRHAGDAVRVLFLDAADDVIVRRFEGTRRRHPVPAEGVSEGIDREREALEPIKAMADVVVDTSELNVHQLRDRLIDLFERDDPSIVMQTSVVSFGYKYGLPLDVDLVFDCRFLPNPHWVDELRPLPGTDERVSAYVEGQPQYRAFVERLEGLMDVVLPGYVQEGKAYLTVAVGCTGGHHRSVVVGEELGRYFRNRGHAVAVEHRDIARS